MYTPCLGTPIPFDCRQRALGCRTEAVGACSALGAADMDIVETAMGAETPTIKPSVFPKRRRLAPKSGPLPKAPAVAGKAAAGDGAAACPTRKQIHSKAYHHALTELTARTSSTLCGLLVAAYCYSTLLKTFVAPACLIGHSTRGALASNSVPVFVSQLCLPSFSQECKRAGGSPDSCKAAAREAGRDAVQHL